jgi:hypothetical protein
MGQTQSPLVATRQPRATSGYLGWARILDRYAASRALSSGVIRTR